MMINKSRFSEQEKILADETEFDKRKCFLDHITSILGTSILFINFLEVLEAHGGSYSYLATNIQESLEQFKLQEPRQEQRSNVSHLFPMQQDEDTGKISTSTLYIV